MYIASAVLLSSVTFMIEYFGDIYKAARCSSKTVIPSAKSTQDGVFSEGCLHRPVRSLFDSWDSCVVSI